jgi:hypothetical protein
MKQSNIQHIFNHDVDVSALHISRYYDTQKYRDLTSFMKIEMSRFISRLVTFGFHKRAFIVSEFFV